MRTDAIEKEAHESYGLMSISRTTGTPRSLFGSTIKHGNTIVLEIHEANVTREFQKNHYHASKRLMEIEMSAAQFAEAITTLNVGTGTPVTIRYVNGEKNDRAEPPEVDFRAKAQGELKKEMGELAETIEELSKDAIGILTRKGTPIKADEKEKILKDLMFIVQEIRSNIPFAHECFQEAVEETIVQAKAEIDSCLTNMREKLGESVINGKIVVPLLESKGEDKKTLT